MFFSLKICWFFFFVSSEPLPVTSAQILDYKESPETGVVFQIESPRGNVFSRVNISFTEGQERRYMLYKGSRLTNENHFMIKITKNQDFIPCVLTDFFQGKTVFKHWLPGVCYQNVTFQLISEATVSQTPLVTHSDVTHSPAHHRMGEETEKSNLAPQKNLIIIHIIKGVLSLLVLFSEYHSMFLTNANCSSSSVPLPPLNISHKIVHLKQGVGPGDTSDADVLQTNQENARSSRQAREISQMQEQDEETTSEEALEAYTQVPFHATEPAATEADVLLKENQTMEADSQSDWYDPTTSPSNAEDEEFVNTVVPEYEDSNEPGSAMNLPEEAAILPTKLPPILLELRWLPPRPPTSYDGFNIYIYRDGNKES